MKRPTEPEADLAIRSARAARAPASPRAAFRPRLASRPRAVVAVVAAALVALSAAAAPASGASRKAQAAQAGDGAIRRFALAVGSSQGGSGRDTLLYAESDARAFGALLGEMGGVSPGDVRVLREPSPEDLDAAFRDLRAKVAAQPGGRGRTEVIVYYSGHADDGGLLLGGRGFAYDRFRRQIDSIPADVRIAVLDACASGAITRLKGGRRRPAFSVDASSDMRGYAFITSSSPDEASQESDQIRGSFFTHYLVSGMRGAADVSGDGKITLGEAYQFAFHETLARTERTKGGPQHPAYDMKLSGTGDVVMTDTRQTSAGLILAKDLEGRLFVRGKDNLLVAELYKPAGRAVELGLAPGGYSIRLERNKSLSASDLELAEGRRTEISARDFAAVAVEATTFRGGAAGEAGPGGAGASAPGGTVPAAGAVLAAAPSASASPLPAASPAPSGLAMEVQDQLDIPAGPRGKGTLSLGLLLNRQRDDFTGLQLTVFFNQASRQVRGGQVSAFGNLGQGNMQGTQLSAIGNILLDTLRGGQGGGIFNFALEEVRGGQGAGTFNLSGNLRGGQGAGVANFGLGQVRGGQGAGVLNVAEGLKGGQGAGVANLNFGEAKGGQGAGVLNVSGALEGGQGAGVMNVVGGALRGGQGAGVLNVAGGVEGGQAAGVMNLSFGNVSGGQGAGVVNGARDVKGFQMAAVLNVARDVEGFQFGLVNISRDFREGIPVGLINYSHTGLHSVNLWTDELGYQHSTLLTGTRNYYTFFSIGEKLSSDRNLVALGLGLGLQFPWGRNFLGADAGAFDLIEDWEFDDDESNDAPELYRLRLQAGRELLPYVSVFGGLSFNYLWDADDLEHNLPWKDYPVEPFKGDYVWPGAFVGIRLGR